MKKKLLSLMLALVLLFSCTMTVQAATTEQLEAFVTRFYKEILNREPEEAGLADWVGRLSSGQAKGADIGYGFIKSQEFLNRNVSNTEYLNILYRAFFNRAADTDGFNYWMNALNSGKSRLFVYKGFAESQEFTNLCNAYDIQRGTIDISGAGNGSEQSGTTTNAQVTAFVTRCYTLFLDRSPDAGGLSDWTNKILSGKQSAKQVAYGFAFSPEFTNKQLSNEEYIKVLYRVLLDREADDSGLANWLDILAEGESREFVFGGFADSVEFGKLCQSYGISAGPSLGIPSNGSTGSGSGTGSGSDNTGTGSGSGGSTDGYQGIGYWVNDDYVSLEAGFILELPQGQWTIEKTPVYDEDTNASVEFMMVDNATGEDMLIFAAYDFSDYITWYDEEIHTLCIDTFKESCVAEGMEVSDGVYNWALGNNTYKYFFAYDSVYGDMWCYNVAMLSNGRFVVIITASPDESFPYEIRKKFTGMVG